MLVRLHVVIDKEDEDIEKRVKDKLSFLCANSHIHHLENSLR